MGELADLHARILAEPDDDAARLVYADALTDAGDPRGEFVAIHCALAAAGIHATDDLIAADVSPAELARLAGLLRRVDQLLDRYAATWATALVDDAGATVTYRRGLPHRLRIEGEHSISRRGARDVGALARALDRSTVQSLDISQTNTAELAALAAEPPRRIRRLALFRPRITDSVVLGRLLASMPDLESFELYGPDAFEIAVDVVAPLRSLVELRLYECGLDRAGLDALGGFAFAAGLQQLLVGCNRRLADDAVAVLDGRFPTLTEVQLIQCNLTPAAFARAALHVPRVVSLDGNEIKAAGLAALLEQPTVSNLESLDVTSFGIGDEGLAAIARCPRLGKLQKLVADHAGFTDVGITALAQSASARLHTLIARQTSMTALGLTALLSSPRHALRELRCWPSVRDGHAFARAIATSPHAGSLRHLELMECDLDDDDVVAITSALPLLRCFDAPRGRINNRGARALASHPIVRSRLYDNQIRIGGQRAWLEAPALVELDTDGIDDPELTGALRAYLGTGFWRTEQTPLRPRSTQVVFPGSERLSDDDVRALCATVRDVVFERHDGKATVRDPRQPDAQPITIVISYDPEDLSEHPAVLGRWEGLVSLVYRAADKADLDATLSALAFAFAAHTGGVAYDPVAERVLRRTP